MVKHTRIFVPRPWPLSIWLGNKPSFIPFVVTAVFCIDNFGIQCGAPRTIHFHRRSHLEGSQVPATDSFFPTALVASWADTGRFSEPGPPLCFNPQLLVYSGLPVGYMCLFSEICLILVWLGAACH